MNRIIKQVPLFALLLLLILPASSQASSSAKGEDPRYKSLSEMADRIDKTCPVKMDRESRMDGVKLVEKTILQYELSLYKRAKKDLDIPALRKRLQKQVKRDIKRNKNFAQLREMGVTFRYIYRDMKGKYLLTLEFTPKDYR
ncbi:MAG: hypothetical protein CSA97_03795 [Bacteroidetes bacterium]|nr:MAG: hypothetical protein CSA97_03795 [Bacteroidota bacterium]